MPGDDLTRLQRIMRLAYEMQPEDEQELSRAILSQRTRAWRDAIQEEAAKLGVRRRANAPSGADLDTLRQMSQEDARSIRRTYNADLEREIRRLFDENPRGNRTYYTSRLDAWYEKRRAWKDKQIALWNNKTARHEATEQFKALNGIRGAKSVFTGPAPVCDDCADKFAMGEVEQRVVDRYPTPLHLGCPHSWVVTQMPRPDVPLNELWMG